MDESINELKEWKSVSYKGEWIMLRKRALLPFAGLLLSAYLSRY